MIGLFQADLPIGRRLWIMLLTLVAFGLIKQIEPPTLTSISISLIEDILLFFGYVAVLSSVFLLIPEFLRNIIFNYQDRRLEKTNPYEAIVKNRKFRWWFYSLQDLAFVLATVFAVKDFGTNTMYSWGLLGLGGLLVDEVINWDDIYQKTKQVLEIKFLKNNKIRARLVRSEEVEEFSFTTSDWLLELQSLRHSGWEIVESNLLETKRSIVLERDATINFMVLLAEKLRL